MTGILISVFVASFIALQAALVGAAPRVTVPVAGGLAAFMAAFWALAIGTLFPQPDLWATLLRQMAISAAAAGIGAAALTWAAARLITKINTFKQKYPDR